MTLISCSTKINHFLHKFRAEKIDSFYFRDRYAMLLQFQNHLLFASSEVYESKAISGEMPIHTHTQNN